MSDAEPAAAAVEDQARRANAPDLWDRLWQQRGQAEWREVALDRVYARICQLVPHGSRVVDLGGGPGMLGRRLVAGCAARVTIIDQSGAALEEAARAGLEVVQERLDGDWLLTEPADVVVATELLEHLDTRTRAAVLYAANEVGAALLSVPNDRLGPDEEPQHAVRWCAADLLDLLRETWGDACRVECLGSYLLAVCGRLASKAFKLSVCLPVRDEAKDLEATLASFRGVADQLVVGVDPRTTDDSWAVAMRYADSVFWLDTPTGPAGTAVPDKGVHFAHVRNQCMERCGGDWIFMTEGHERLASGVDDLLRLDQLVPPWCDLGFPWRTGKGVGGGSQMWGFPLLTRNKPELRYARPTHNVVDYPAGTRGRMLPGVRTRHERHADRAAARSAQRRVQNRLTLLDDWLATGSPLSLHYLGAEYRDASPDKAIERLEELLALPPKGGAGAMRYHSRLMLARLYARRGDTKAARRVLLDATGDDWSRTEHWCWLGDLAYEAEAYEEALQFYRYAATRIGDPPFSLWWLDEAFYSYLPAQRLVQTLARLGKAAEALYWARRVLDLLPDDAPDGAVQEAREHVATLEQCAAEPARVAS